MIPKLTDDAVSRLPLDTGRAELLEEIMTTVAPERTAPTRPPTRRRRWAAPIAAAAAVALLAAASAWWSGDSPARDGSGQVATASAADYLVLDAPGWKATSASAGGGAIWENGRQSLEITVYPAGLYDEYVQDRRHISDPAADGQPLTILGVPAQMWAYTARDHASIRQVVDGQWAELRGAGMDEAAYRDLLGRLRAVDRAGFEASLPSRFVTDSERPAAVATILDGIRQHVDPVVPAGSPEITSDQPDPYQLGAAVAGAVACDWLDEYAAARAAADPDRAETAAAALATARQWPVLEEMAKTGGYSAVLWDYADQVAAGRVPEGYAAGLGCP